MWPRGTYQPSSKVVAWEKKEKKNTSFLTNPINWLKTLILIERSRVSTNVNYSAAVVAKSMLFECFCACCVVFSSTASIVQYIDVISDNQRENIYFPLSDFFIVFVVIDILKSRRTSSTFNAFMATTACVPLT